MTAETALTGRALDRALAEAMGWQTDGYLWSAPAAPFEYMGLPQWSTSVDALIAGPEARLRAAGWRHEVLWLGGWCRSCWTTTGQRPEYIVTWTPPPPDAAWTDSGATEAEARARACLAALAALALREEQG